MTVGKTFDGSLSSIENYYAGLFLALYKFDEGNNKLCLILPITLGGTAGSIVRE